MIPNLIGLVGAAGAGKDTVAELLKPYGYRRVAFADAMREGAYESDPYIETAPGGYARLSALVAAQSWDACKRRYPDVRRYLQRYGTAMRQQLPGCWVDIVADKISDAHDAGEHVVVTDVRFPDEAQLIRARGGLLVKVLRDVAGLAGENAQHVTERNVDSIECPVALDNNGTLDDLVDAVRFLHNVASVGAYAR